jgi:hypothetical protein
MIVTAAKTNFWGIFLLDGSFFGYVLIVDPLELQDLQ